LRSRLELAEQEWEQTRQMALESLGAGLAAYDAYAKFKLSTIQIENENSTHRAATEEGFEVDVEHWTEGKWSAGRRELEQRRKQIAEPGANVSLENLRACEQAGQRGMTEATVLAATAKYAVMASTMRADLQRDFLEKMEGFGYQCENNVWQEEDQRRANRMVLVGTSGERLAITLTPQEESGVLSNRLDIDFNDERCNEEERRKKIAVISSALAQCYGLPEEVIEEEYRCKPGTSWTSNAPEAIYNTAEFAKPKSCNAE